MPDVKISAAADPGTLVATDKVPMARSASTTAYAATMAEIATYAATTAPVQSFNTRTGAVVLQQSDITAVGALRDIGRNRLHNSAFRINQRSYVSGTALAAGVYAHDRWKAGAGGCTYTFTQTQPATTITITAGSLQQIVEALDVEGGTYTLSWTGTAQGRVGAGSYAASPVTVTGLAANTAITVEFNAGTLGTVQFEVGNTTTPYERQSMRYDLANCQRFYETGAWLHTGYNLATNANAAFVSFVVAKRAAPTVAISGAPSYVNASGASVSALGLNGLWGAYTVTASNTASSNFVWTASADL